MASLATSSAPARDAIVASTRAAVGSIGQRAPGARVLLDAQRERLEHEHVELGLGGKHRTNLVDRADGDRGQTQACRLGGEAGVAHAVAVALGHGDERGPGGGDGVADPVLMCRASVRCRSR